MKHTNNISIALPAKASLLETQQKVAITAAAITAFNSLAGALGSWRNFLNPEE